MEADHALAAERPNEQPLQRLARMFAALSATNEAILRTKSQEELYQRVCEAAMRGGNFVGVAIFLRDATTDKLRFAAGSGSGIEHLRKLDISINETSPTGQGLAGLAFRTREARLSNDYLNDPRSLPWRHELRAAGVRAAAALPFLRGEQPFGVLLVYLPEVGALDDEIVALLSRMAENVSFTLDNLDRDAAREASEQSTRRLARMFAALSATNEAILRAKSPDELYGLVCDAAAHSEGSLATIVLLAEPGSSWLTPVAGSSEHLRQIRQTRFSIDPVNPYGKGVCGTAFRTRQPCVNPDILTSGEARPWHDAGRRTGAVACAAMPLVKAGQSIGVMLYFIGTSWARDPEIITLLARMAENVSFALDNFEHEERRRAAEAHAQYLATHDGLTGLPNRVMFGQTLDETISLAQRCARTFSVMFVDLDRFKLINDTLGHAAGDLLLQEVAGRLRRCVRDSDVVARLGGDEFVVLLRDISDTRQVASIARKILAAVIQPIVIHGQECRVTASIGVSRFPIDGTDEKALTRNADAAMYLAKEEGRSRFRIYTREIKTQSIERLMLETSLRRALENDELALHYQAKQDLETGSISGVEALLRWKHPEFGLLLPDKFIPLAEETGLIVTIGKWVLETACRQNVAWQRQGLPAIRVAVNLSPRQFNDEQLVADIGAALDKSGMEAELLELEITESMMMHNVPQALRLVRSIKAMGVRLAVDDFGTGYSSMSLIKQFPIDTLKVDQSFVRDIGSDADDRAITEAIIALGKALDLNIVAEGVESKEQEAFLRERACDEIQGYLFSRPIPGDAFVEFVTSHGVSQLKAQAARARRLSRRPRARRASPRRS